MLSTPLPTPHGVTGLLRRCLRGRGFFLGPPAPGAIILVPLKAAGPDGPTPQLNQELAEFLATQPLSEVAP